MVGIHAPHAAWLCDAVRTTRPRIVSPRASSRVNNTPSVMKPASTRMRISGSSPSVCSARASQRSASAAPTDGVIAVAQRAARSSGAFELPSAMTRSPYAASGVPNGMRNTALA